MTASFRSLSELRDARNAALHRARWCKDKGLTCFSADVSIARRFQRILLRELRRRS